MVKAKTLLAEICTGVHLNAGFYTDKLQTNRAGNRRDVITEKISVENAFLRLVSGFLSV